MKLKQKSAEEVAREMVEQWMEAGGGPVYELLIEAIEWGRANPEWKHCKLRPDFSEFALIFDPPMEDEPGEMVVDTICDGDIYADLPNPPEFSDDD